MSMQILLEGKVLIHHLADKAEVITAEEKAKLLDLYVAARNAIDSEIEAVQAKILANEEVIKLKEELDTIKSNFNDYL